MIPPFESVGFQPDKGVFAGKVSGWNPTYML